MDGRLFDTKTDGSLQLNIIIFRGQSRVPKMGVSPISMSSLNLLCYLLQKVVISKYCED